MCEVAVAILGEVVRTRDVLGAAIDAEDCCWGRFQLAGGAIRRWRGRRKVDFPEVEWIGSWGRRVPTVLMCKRRSPSARSIS
jgi:hypothetical protein